MKNTLALTVTLTAIIEDFSAQIGYIIDSYGEVTDT